MWRLIKVLKSAANRRGEKYCSVRHYTKPPHSSFQGCYKLHHRCFPAKHYLDVKLNFLYPEHYVLLHVIILFLKETSLRHTLRQFFSSFTHVCFLKISTRYQITSLFLFKVPVHSLKNKEVCLLAPPPKKDFRKLNYLYY